MAERRAARRPVVSAVRCGRLRKNGTAAAKLSADYSEQSPQRHLHYRGVADTVLTNDGDRAGRRLRKFIYHSLHGSAELL